MLRVDTKVLIKLVRISVADVEASTTAARPTCLTQFIFSTTYGAGTVITQGKT